MHTKLLIEQHFHGCYGIDFNRASVDDVIELSYKIKKEGIGGIFPTIVTDTIENTKKQINIIKQASEKQTHECAKILGIHLEGIFLNPAKKGIHNADNFLTPTIENFKQIEDDFIKIVTLAPELAEDDLFKYLHSHGIKIQAGHCVGGDLSFCDGVTHIFNAMSPITHKNIDSTVLSALNNDDIYTEIIADGVHVNDEALKLLLNVKSQNKILLISDCLPCTHSNIEEFIFAGQKIYYKNGKATSCEGTIAGSTMLLADIIKVLNNKGLFNPQYINNPYIYHNIDIEGQIEWDEDCNIVKIIS